jgi:hypothetical protein
MASDDLLSEDKVDSVTVRHLRDPRRTQDMFLELLKRQTEVTGRLARDMSEMKVETERNFNELRSDVLLLENRTIAAAENDEYFRRRFDGISGQLNLIIGDIAETKKSVDALTSLVHVSLAKHVT